MRPCLVYRARQLNNVSGRIFLNSRCVASYVARMGQCFSTSIDSVGTGISEGALSEKEDDLKTVDQKYCFSDGIGRISKELAAEVRL